MSRRMRQRILGFVWAGLAAVVLAGSLTGCSYQILSEEEVQVAYDEAFAAGEAAGRRAAETEAAKELRAQSRERYDLGHDAGYDQGYDEGYDAGYDEGYQLGKEKTLEKAAAEEAESRTSGGGGGASGAVSKPQSSASESTPDWGADYQSGTVYITDTGSKYHRSGCRYLSKSCHPISLSAAKASGYTACKVCKPAA